MNNYTDAKIAANNYSLTLKANDDRFDNHVTIQHINGSFFHLTHAFAMVAGDFYFVFTENSFGPMIFYQGDITSIAQTELTEIQLLP